MTLNYNGSTYKVQNLAAAITLLGGEKKIFAVDLPYITMKDGGVAYVIS